MVVRSTGNQAGSGTGGGVFLVGTTNQTDPPSFTMHGGTISNNTAGASDGGGGGVYVGEKCSFTMDGGTITGNTATAGNGGGIYIHFNAGNVSISNATITDNKATATGNTSCGHGGGIYSERGVTVGNVTITGNNSTFEGGGIYGKGAITLTDATVTGNNQYDVYYDGKESTTPELTVSGSVKAGYYANYAWKLPILVSGALSEDSVIRVGVYEGIKPGYGESLAIAEPASGVTLSAENFKADAADSVTSLGEDGKVYLVPLHARNGRYRLHLQEVPYAIRRARGRERLLSDADGGVSECSRMAAPMTLLRDVNAHRKVALCLRLLSDAGSEWQRLISSEGITVRVGGREQTQDSDGQGFRRQAAERRRSMSSFTFTSNGTLAVDDSYTGDISRVELQAGGALERFGGKIGELVLSNAA